MIIPVRLNGRELKPHKAIVAPSLDSRTVLTNSPWEFVSLWLRRQEKNTALLYWEQAREFARASEGMSVQSAPLLHYYSFMNAAKALLNSKDVSFVEHHGIRADSTTSESGPIDLANEGVQILNTGVLPALASYLGDTESRRTHLLQELLFNLAFVHRTYCLTYQSQHDLFFPLSDCLYVFDADKKKAYLKAQLSKELCDGQYIDKLPPAFISDDAASSPGTIRSVYEVKLCSDTLTSAIDVENMADLNRKLRQDLQHISGSHTLWYVKAMVSGPTRLNRSTLTLTLAAMHRLSEICRYRPIQLAKLMAGQQNWLITEFVSMSPYQFLDGIAAEITGHQFMLPNVRPAG